MCGICGGWFNAQMPPQAMEHSLAAMEHRGPDDWGVYQDGPVSLGNRRLSIIDLEHGHQPVMNEDGSIIVVFNGEIYNYKDLATDLKSKGHIFESECDTEVLVHLYEEHGSSMCSLLRGMFAFAVWDAREHVLMLARDRFGKKPLYYTCQPHGTLFFASELKSLRVLATESGIRWSIRDQGIYDYLSLGVIPEPETVFRDVFAVTPGTWMLFDGRETKSESYWNLEYQPGTDMSYAEVLDRARALVSDAVRVRLRSDVPLGIFLSGGVDSSVVAYEAARAIGKSVRTFTVAVDDPAMDESPLAAKTAGLLGVENTILHLETTPQEDLERLVNHYDQPFADSSAIPSMKIAALASEYVKVIVNGDGGDELFAGYRRYLAAMYYQRFLRVPAVAVRTLMRCLQPWAAARRSFPGFAYRFLRGLTCGPGERYLVWLTDMFRDTDKRQFWLPEAVRSTEDWIESILPANVSSLSAQLTTDIQVNLRSDLLVKMDRATMASSVEARSPFMDHLLAEFVACLPDRYKLRRGQRKAVLRDAYRDRLPSDVIDGPKRGFSIPLLRWMTHDLKPVLMDTVDAKDAKVRSYLDGRFIHELLQGNVMQDRNWAMIVYALLVLEIWLKRFA